MVSATSRRRTKINAPPVRRPYVCRTESVRCSLCALVAVAVIACAVFVSVCTRRGMLSAAAVTCMAFPPSALPSVTVTRPLRCVKTAPMGSAQMESSRRVSRAVSACTLSAHVFTVVTAASAAVRVTLSLLAAWLCSVCIVFAERQLAADRASSTMGANLYRLNSARKAVKGAACALAFGCEFLREFCAFCILLLRLFQQLRDVLVHSLVCVVHAFCGSRGVGFPVGDPCNGGTYAA